MDLVIGTTEIYETKFTYVGVAKKENFIAIIFNYKKELKTGFAERHISAIHMW